mgnify:CR=1 FL=1
MSLLLPSFLFAQVDAKFQQEVNYKIAVTLNDEMHTLDGNIEIEYTNNASTALSEIWMHLWPNAYKNINTAFAKQQLRLGNTEFYFAQNSDFGYLDQLNFQINGANATWEYDKENPDIAKIILTQPLESGAKITITTPFLLKIPASFSRLGHVDQSYQLTQWFPKPAVFDHKGWHPMPYLNMGEFYSEFGDFEVSITLPDNYVVGATGVLQTASEKKFLAQKVTETDKYFEERVLRKSDYFITDRQDTFPTSSQTMKTLVYTAEKVHDFAWFADKRFKVQKSEVTLESGKKVDTWTMFTGLEANYWEKSIEYVNRSVEFYSEMVGEYPWPQATAVQSALSAGGGMEYPMITVIGLTGGPKDLDQVITHEVGHNWFYGILASNERDHAWMDEGMNTYYEYRYMKKNYGGSRIVEMGPAFFEAGTPVDNMEAAWLFTARKSLDQAPETHSDDFTQLNYGISSYVKPGSAMQHLEGYLGLEQFDEIMQGYYQEWAFKHPYPEDFRAYVESKTDKNLAWFFDGYINSTLKMDYALADISNENDAYNLTIKNKGDLAAPFPISGMKDDKIVTTHWYDGFFGSQNVTFPAGDYDQIILDAQNTTLELYRTNNNIKTLGFLKKVEPLRVKFAPSVENPRKSDIFWLPSVGFNTYDKFMAGLTLYNRTLPSKRFEFSVSPLFSFKTKKLVGVGDVAYNFYPKGKALQQVTLGVHAKQFNYNYLDSLNVSETEVTDTYFSYEKLEPYVKVNFRTTPKSNFKHGIELRSSRIMRDVGTTFDSSFFAGNRVDTNWIHRLTYFAKKKNGLNPWSFRFALEQQNQKDIFNRTQDYVRASVDFRTAYLYNINRKINMRFFLGYLFKNTEDQFENSVLEEGFYPSGQGFNDYRYDELYFGRSENTGLWSQQIDLRDGGMKTAVGSSLSQIQGGSNRMMVAFNIDADFPKDLPFNLPLRPYADLVYSKDARPSFEGSFADQIWASAGISLEFFDGAFGIHFPILNSNNITEIYNNSGRGIERGKFFRDYPSRITFNIDLKRFNPWNIAEESIGL